MHIALQFAATVQHSTYIFLLGEGAQLIEDAVLRLEPLQARVLSATNIAGPAPRHHDLIKYSSSSCSSSNIVVVEIVVVVGIIYM